MNKSSARVPMGVCGLALVGGLVAGPSAWAAPLDKGHFTDSGTEQFDCDGTPTEAHFDVSGSFNVVMRSGEPYFRESVRGTQVYRNLDNDGTYTRVFSVNSRDAKVTDNGDGTLTIVSHASGNDVWYDTHGNVVLRDPGQIRFQFMIDDNGTPDDPFDDFEVDGSFQVQRDSTGRNDTEGRNFCEDLVIFTS